MKSQQLLSIWAASALAHEQGSSLHHHHHHHHDETAGQGHLLRWPEALSASPTAQCPAINATDTLGITDFSSCPVHGQHHRHSHAWTGYGPCFTSGTSGAELCVFSDAGFADGRGMSIITTAARAAYLASHPAFVDPASVRGRNRDPLSVWGHPRTEVRPVPGKGMGLVATEDIERGDLIMAQTPSLFIDYRTVDHLPREQYLVAQMAAIDGLSREHRDLVMNMTTHDDRATLERDVDRAALIDRLISVNAFEIDPAADDPEGERGDKRKGFYVLFPEIARINHDCRPNAEYYFDHATMTQFVHAVAPVRRGDEISVSYIEEAAPRAERQRSLRGVWGFECTCRQCTRAGVLAAASDARVRQINDLTRELRRYRPDSRATPQVAELVVALHEQERLWSTVYRAYALAALEHNGAGDWAAATRYARLAVEHGVPAKGEADRDVRDMMELAEDPWAHWSWMLRAKKRAGWKAKR